MLTVMCWSWHSHLETYCRCDWDCFTLVSVLPEITCGVPQGSILGSLMCFLNMLPLGYQYSFPFLCCDDAVLSMNPSVTSVTLDASHIVITSVYCSQLSNFWVLQPLYFAHCMANQWKKVTHFKITHSSHDTGMMRSLHCVLWKKLEGNKSQ